jgi:plastocyanin
MRRSIRPLLAVLAPLLLTFCSDSSANSVNPVVNGNMSLLDQCDSASFNAGVGAGACVGAGTMTLAQFNAELTANMSVAAWRFDPTTMTITVGGAITATNQGGEVHTFTAVNQFGGGVVPSLNTASGNPVEAPECKDITAADHVAPGGTFKTNTATVAGTYLYQCCIHPWMRATVTVTGS